MHLYLCRLPMLLYLHLCLCRFLLRRLPMLYLYRFPERQLPTLLLQTAAVAACFFLIRDTADYRYLGAALIVCFYLTREQRLSQLLMLILWAVIEYLLGGVGFRYFFCACVSAVLLYFYNGERGRSLGRFFYWLYPAHLAVLGLLRLLLVS